MGLHVYVNGYIRLDQLNLEGMQNRSRRKPECGNVLVKRGEHIYLYNTNDNSDSLPIHFNNLDEYIEYVQNQRSQNIQCPILFLQEESDVQGNTFYKAKPSPHDLTKRDFDYVQPIIDSSRTSKTFNKNHKGTNVKLNKYPTIAKYENGKVQYYKDEREAKKMLNWALKKPSKYTNKKHNKHNKKFKNRTLKN